MKFHDIDWSICNIDPVIEIRYTLYNVLNPFEIQK